MHLTKSGRPSLSPEKEGPVSEWAYGVASSLQRLVGVAYFGSRESFEQALRQLAFALPALKGDSIEALWLREKLASVSYRTAVVFHSSQGCPRQRCTMPRVEALDLLWKSPRRSAGSALARWTAALLLSFDRAHLRIGAPVRTAKLFRRSVRVRRAIGDIANRFKMSSTTLAGLFYDRYGLTPHAYHARVRIRAAVLALHGSDDKVEYVAWQAGYASPANFYIALDKSLAMSPTAVRRLDEAALDVLLQERLEIDLAKLVRWQKKGFSLRRRGSDRNSDPTQ